MDTYSLGWGPPQKIPNSHQPHTSPPTTDITRSKIKNLQQRRPSRHCHLVENVKTVEGLILRAILIIDAAALENTHDVLEKQGYVYKEHCGCKDVHVRTQVVLLSTHQRLGVYDDPNTQQASDDTS